MARKRRPSPRSRGTIMDRGEGKWLVRAYVGRDDRTGKRQYASRTVTGTKRDAQKALTGLLSEIDGGTFIPPSRDTLADVIELWLESKTNVAPSVHYNYSIRLRTDVVPRIGAMKIQKVTRDDIQRVYNELRDSGMAAGTIEHTHVALKQVFDWAVEGGLLSSNPTLKTTRIKRKRTPKNILTPEEMQRLFEATEGDPYHPLWVLLLTTGIRPNEALALKWTDYDGDSIYIQRSLRVDPNDSWRFKEDETKTAAANRRVVLFDYTRKVLDEHREHQLRNVFIGKNRNPKGYIFCTRTGNPINITYVRKVWKKALENAGLEHRRLYDTRHTHISHLLMAGEHPKVAQERAGHSTVTMTLDTYSTVLPSVHREATNRLEQFVFQRTGVSTN